MKRFALAVPLVVALPVAAQLPSCSHDWDAYEVVDGSSGQGGGAGGGGAGGGAQHCVAYCDVETRCLSTMTVSDCLQQCETETADCPPGQLAPLAECAAQGEGECNIGTETAVCTCLAVSTPCFDCL